MHAEVQYGCRRPTRRVRQEFAKGIYNGAIRCGDRRVCDSGSHVGIHLCAVRCPEQSFAQLLTLSDTHEEFERQFKLVYATLRIHSSSNANEQLVHSSSRETRFCETLPSIWIMPTARSLVHEGRTCLLQHCNTKVCRISCKNTNSLLRKLEKQVLEKLQLFSLNMRLHRFPMKVFPINIRAFTSRGRYK